MIPQSVSKSGKVEVKNPRQQGSHLLNIKRTNEKKKLRVIPNKDNVPNFDVLNPVVEHNTDKCPTCGGDLPKNRKYCTTKCFYDRNKK